MAAAAPKPQDDGTLADGASKADAARPPAFEPKPGAKRSEDAPDAAELAGTKRRSREDDPEAKSAPGALAPKDVTTETDDGAG